MISSKESICWFYIMSCKMHLQMSLLNNSRPGGGGGWGGGGRREEGGRSKVASKTEHKPIAGSGFYHSL